VRSGELRELSRSVAAVRSGELRERSLPHFKGEITLSGVFLLHFTSYSLASSRECLAAGEAETSRLAPSIIRLDDEDVR